MSKVTLAVSLNGLFSRYREVFLSIVKLESKRMNTVISLLSPLGKLFVASEIIQCKLQPMFAAAPYMVFSARLTKLLVSHMTHKGVFK